MGWPQLHGHQQTWKWNSKISKLRIKAMLLCQINGISSPKWDGPVAWPSDLEVESPDLEATYNGLAPSPDKWSPDLRRPTRCCCCCWFVFHIELNVIDHLTASMIIAFPLTFPCARIVWKRTLRRYQVFYMKKAIQANVARLYLPNKKVTLGHKEVYNMALNLPLFYSLGFWFHKNDLLLW